MDGTVGGGAPLEVRLEPAEINVSPGGAPATATVSVQNMGTDVDQFSIEIEGLDPAWYSAEAKAVALFPGDSMPLAISIHPTPGGVQPGRYPFTVRARSHSDPNLVAGAGGAVLVGGSRAFRVEIAPQRVTAHAGKYRLTLTNGGGVPLPMELSGYDEPKLLSYNFRNARPTVPASGRLTVPLSVKPRSPTIFGQSKPYRFNVAARPAGGSDADWKITSGELVHTPRIALWMLPALAVAVLLPLLAYLAWSGCWFCAATTPVAQVSPTPEPTLAPTAIAEEPTPTIDFPPTFTTEAVFPTPIAQPTQCRLAVMEHREGRDTRFPPGLAGPAPYVVGERSYQYKTQYVSPMFVDREGTIDKVIVGRVDVFKVDWAGDGVIMGHLTAPSGKRARIFNWVCGPGGPVSMHITLDDGAESGVPYSCSENFAGVFKPDYGPLSIFKESQAQGTWVLELEAYTNEEKSPGFFNKWELELCLR